MAFKQAAKINLNGKRFLLVILKESNRNKAMEAKCKYLVAYRESACLLIERFLQATGLIFLE